MSGIMMAAMAGRRNPVADPLPTLTAADTVLSPSAAAASAGFNADGTSFATNDAPANWYVPTTGAVGAGYWVRATLNSGTAPTGTLSSWLQLNVVRSWGLSQSGVGSKTCQLAVSVATDSGGTNIVASGVINITAQVDL